MSLTSRILEGFAELSVASQLIDPDDKPNENRIEIIGTLLDFYNKAEKDKSWLKIMFDHGKYLSIKRKYENTPSHEVIYSFRIMQHKPVNGFWIKRKDGVFPIIYDHHHGQFAKVMVDQMVERGLIMRPEFMHREHNRLTKVGHRWRTNALSCINTLKNRILK